MAVVLLSDSNATGCSYVHDTISSRAQPSVLRRENVESVTSRCISNGVPASVPTRPLISPRVSARIP